MKNSLPQNILFVINTSTYFSGLINVVLLCRSKLHYQPTVYFDGEYPTILHDIELCKSNNISYIVRNAGQLQKNFVFNWIHQVLLIFANIFRIELLKSFLFYIEERQSVEKTLNSVKPSLVILGGDNVWYSTSTFIRMARQQKIPSLIIPQWMAGPSEPAEYIYNNPAYDTKKISNKAIAAIFPKWALSYKQKRLVRLPANRIIIKELFKLAPPQPWVLHSGFSDLIALESQAMMDYCIKEQLPKNKLTITGSVDLDTLYSYKHNRKSELVLLHKQFNLSPSLPIILTALPADFLYIKGGRPECEFTNYQNILRFWITSLASQKKYHVLVSPHPSISPDSVKYLEQFNVKIIPDRIMKYMPLCDIFVAACSSVIQWAITCGIPVINYDVFKFRYHDYDEAKGVIYVDQKSDFVKKLFLLSNDKEYYNQVKNAQNKCSKNWGILDGNSGTRILSLINQMING